MWLHHAISNRLNFTRSLMFFGYFKTPQNNWVIGEILNYYNLFDWRNDFHIFGHVIKEKWMTSWVACTLHICIVHHWHQQPITVYWLIILCLQLDGSCLAFNYRRSIHDWKQAMHSRFLLGNGPLKRHHFKCEALIAFTSVELQNENESCTIHNWLILKSHKTLQKNRKSDFVSRLAVEIFDFKWLWKLGYDSFFGVVCYWLSYFPCNCKINFLVFNLLYIVRNGNVDAWEKETKKLRKKTTGNFFFVQSMHSNETCKLLR